MLRIKKQRSDHKFENIYQCNNIQYSITALPECNENIVRQTDSKVI